MELTTKLIIIGLGRVGKKLIQMLSKDYIITCIDIDQNELDEAKKLSINPINSICGDATSRLVLESAQVEQTDTIIIAMTSERINLEVARILKEHFTVKRIISIGLTPAGNETLESYGAEVQNIFEDTATGILNQLEHKSKTVYGIGLGKNEIKEVEVHPNSKLTNKPLKTISTINWKVGIIYRNGNIVIPSGNTRLQGKDRVVILGQPIVVNLISDILTFNFLNFPSEYGSSLLAIVTGDETDSFFKEIEYLHSNFKLKKVVFTLDQNLNKNKVKGIEKIIAQCQYNQCDIKSISLQQILSKNNVDNESYGFIVLDKQLLNKKYKTLFLKKKKAFLELLSTKTKSPILLSSGTIPYNKAVVTALLGFNVIHVMEDAFEIASIIKNQITSILVEPSKYISSNDDMDDFVKLKRNILGMSNIYKKSINIDTLQGNPIKCISKKYPEHDLLIVDISNWKKSGIFSSFLNISSFNPDVAWEITNRSTISTLIIPASEEKL